MFSALFSFLGGTAFRWLIGEFVGYFKAKQDHAHELEMMKLQADLDDRVHARNLESIRVQGEVGITTIHAQADADIARSDADAFVEAVKSVSLKTGIALVDAWNGVIRPALATICMALWVLALYNQAFKLTDWDRELIAATLGVFVGGRIRSSQR